MISDLTIGMKVEHKVFNLQENAIADKSGKMAFSYDGDIKPFLGKAVSVTGVVKPGRDRASVMSIQNIEVAKKGTYNPADIFVSLSPEKINSYKKSLMDNLKYFKHEGLKALVGACLNDLNLEKLSALPATISSYGLYRGGALASCAVISEFVIKMGNAYVLMGNGLYSENFDWYTLLAAAMLSSYGMIAYCEGDDTGSFRKTSIGVERGYTSLLVSQLEKINWQNNFITEEEMARLVNVISTAAGRVSQKPGICPTSKEAIILSNAMMAYRDLDMFDFEASKVSDEEPYSFSTKTGRYIGGKAV